MNEESSGEPWFESIATMSALLASRQISPVELVETMLGRVERLNDHLRAYITVTREHALRQAHNVEQEIQSGNYRGALHGIPIALKDNMATRGIRTSCASMVDPDWVPDYDATVWTRLRESGAVLLGKATLSEYAFGHHGAFPEPLNPWRHDRTAGNSSSGSAVSVAAGMAFGALGSDTGGSGRYPAHVNGVVGFKPTYGRVSKRGVTPLSYSLDHVATLTRTVTDSALMLQVIAGHDPQDEHSAARAVPDFRARLRQGIDGLKVGYARGYTFEDVDPDVVSSTQNALKVLTGLGARIEDVRLPFVEQCVAVYTACSLPEAATIHRDRVRDAADRFGEIPLQRLRLGSVIPATDYIHAQRVRKLMRDEFQQLFDRFDVIVGPARATRAGLPDSSDPSAAVMTLEDGRTLDMWRVAPEYSGIYNLVGVPAIVLPMGFSSEGTPLGLQIAGRWFDEATVLRTAYAFEQVTSWHQYHPPESLFGI